MGATKGDPLLGNTRFVFLSLFFFPPHFPTVLEHCLTIDTIVIELSIIISLILTLGPSDGQVAELPGLEPENSWGTPEG